MRKGKLYFSSFYESVVHGGIRTIEEFLLVFDALVGRNLNTYLHLKFKTYAIYMIYKMHNILSLDLYSG